MHYWKTGLKNSLLRWGPSIHHWRWSFGYTSPEEQNTTLWHSVREECVSVCAEGGTYTCVSFMHTPQAQRDPVPLQCSILINPALTEWIWQVMYVLGLRWKGSEEREHDSRVNAKPSKRQKQRAAGPLLDRCSLWGHLPSPQPHKATVCHHKSSPHGQKGINTWPRLTLVNVMNF